MSTVTNLRPAADAPNLTEAEQAKFEQWFDARFEQKMKEREAKHVPAMSIIATKGTLDWAYPPFILASTGAALGYEVNVFFTFYGLLLLKKDLDLEVTPVGNPAMPMKFWTINRKRICPVVATFTPWTLAIPIAPLWATMFGMI